MANVLQKVAGICGAVVATDGAAAITATNVGVGGIRRMIAHRTVGKGHGPITRLMSPGDVGELVKPFIFLDLFQMGAGPRPFGGFGWHPHSGIATVTVLLKCQSWYEETIRPKGELKEGGVEFFRAGRGAWHTGGPVEGLAIKGYQLWIALPADQELSQPDSFYLSPEEVPVVGPAKLVLGSYEGKQSPIPSTETINYLNVNLSPGQRWAYHNPPGHTVAFVAVSAGSLRTGENEQVRCGEMAVFNEVEGDLTFECSGEEATQFMLGTAVKHPYDLHSGSYSVHTSRAALKEGEKEIRSVGEELKRKGTI
jgi:redox-sensitive bicupin YhaK (pirin superfamily)